MWILREGEITKQVTVDNVEHKFKLIENTKGNTLIQVDVGGYSQVIGVNA